MSIGFKEWALICNAIESGDQSLILRKGGIQEGREGFRFEHREFFLFPTRFHEQAGKLKLATDTPLPPTPEGMVSIRLRVRVEWTQLVTSLDQALALAPFHLWKEEVVKERFHWGIPAGLHVAFLRAFRLSAPWIFADSPAYGGCRSWVTLPDPPANITFEPVLDDTTHFERMSKIRNLLE